MGREVEIDNHIGTRFQLRRDWWRVVRLARNQHDTVGAFQLLALGMTRRQIQRLLDTGHLHLIHHGVYAVGTPRLTPEGRWMAAVLTGGERAVLSHASAAMNWKLIEPSPALPHITTATKGRRRPGIVVHSADLAADEITRRSAIPTTTVSRTLLDLAAVTDAFTVERALARVEFHRYPLSPSLPVLLHRHATRRGAGVLRAALGTGHHRLGVTESPLEDRFLRFLDRRRFKRPELNVPLDLGDRRIRVDCVWRELRLAVELDGRAAHERERAFESDRVRDRRLSALGWRPVRITDEQLRGDPDGVDRDLVALGVGRRPQRRRSGSSRGPGSYGARP